MPSRIVFLICLAISFSTARADEAPRFDVSVPGAGRPALSSTPTALQGVTIEQRLGQPLPGDAAFVDEHGKSVHLSDFFGKRPLLLDFVQYRCPMLCTQVLNGQCRAINACSLDPGVDYDILTISFDARETSALSAAKKNLYDAQIQHGHANQGWHFLTGSAEQIQRVTAAAGFHYLYDVRLDQFIHASAIMVVTSDGRMSKYLYGIEYSPNDLRMAIATARQNQAGTLSDAILRYCFHYDPINGRYTLLVTRLLGWTGGFTVLLLGGFVVREFARDRARYQLKPIAEPAGEGA